MRLRSFALVLLALAAAIVLLRTRARSEYIDVQFDDGSTIRLTAGPETADLLDDVYAALDTVA